MLICAYKLHSSHAKGTWALLSNRQIPVDGKRHEDVTSVAKNTAEPICASWTLQTESWARGGRGVSGGASPMQGWVQQYLTSNESSGMLQLHLLDGLITSGTHELQSH